MLVLLMNKPNKNEKLQFEGIKGFYQNYFPELKLVKQVILRILK